MKRSDPEKKVTIVSPLTRIHELETLVEEGADELYCGFVPKSWSDRYPFYNFQEGHELIANRQRPGNQTERKETDSVAQPTQSRYQPRKHEKRQGIFIPPGQRVSFLAKIKVIYLV